MDLLNRYTVPTLLYGTEGSGLEKRRENSTQTGEIKR